MVLLLLSAACALFLALVWLARRYYEYVRDALAADRVAAAAAASDAPGASPRPWSGTAPGQYVVQPGHRQRHDCSKPVVRTGLIIVHEQHRRPPTVSLVMPHKVEAELLPLKVCVDRALMGGAKSTLPAHKDPAGPPADGIRFDDFAILRSIGRGTFGKVCIVQKKKDKKRKKQAADAIAAQNRTDGMENETEPTTRLFAMKYVNKRKCYERDALQNVLREIDLLAELNHPFIVNLWYTFQDVEDMFMVFDLLLGGDLRYHLNQQGRFGEDRAKLYVCEIALAIDYLHRHNVLHRDVKPANILLDDEGHAHLADFNVATRLESGSLATSLAGTRPYMAPEMFWTNAGRCTGYDHAVDWWALGICFYEMLRGRRPFEFTSNASAAAIANLISTTPLTIPCEWSDDLVAFMHGLLAVQHKHRLQSLDQFRQQSYMTRINFCHVLRRKTEPVFVPRSDSLNCDPTYELEEIIVESKPIYNKKKRLSRLSTADVHADADAETRAALDAMHSKFHVFNRAQRLVTGDQLLRALEIEQGIAVRQEPKPLAGQMRDDKAGQSGAYIIGNLSGAPPGSDSGGFRDLIRKRLGFKRA